MTDISTEHIRRKLSDMIYGSSVTIVVISPNIKASKWIDWEIEYCLKEITRNGRTSATNGLIGVVQKVQGAYSWLVSENLKDDGCSVRTIDDSLLYPIISSNRYNLKRPTHSCSVCKTYGQLDGSFMSLIDEDDFIADPNKYIENAYEKAQRLDDFNLRKLRAD